MDAPIETSLHNLKIEHDIATPDSETIATPPTEKADADGFIFGGIYPLHPSLALSLLPELPLT